MLELQLYGRRYCHLCDEMAAALAALPTAGREFSVRFVDIDDDPVLEERYGADIPVLAHGDSELCRHRLDAAAVREYLDRIDDRGLKQGT